MTRPLSSPRKSRSASRSALPGKAGWLSGTALFGFLACQSPGEPDPVAREVVITPRDSIFLPSDSLPVTGVARHTFPPVHGEPCEGNFMESLNCTLDGRMWGCYLGAWQSGIWFDAHCVPGSTKVVYNGHLGFNGIDKSGRKPPRARRQARALA